MRKRILSLLCALVLCLQIIPVYAQSDYEVPDGMIEIKTAEDFKNMKSGNSYYIDDSISIELGEYQMPKFSGTITGGGTVVYTPISNDGYMGLFKELTDSTIDIRVVVATSLMKKPKLSSTMYIGMLAAKAKNVKLGNYFNTYPLNEDDGYYKLPDGIQNLIVGGIFAFTEGNIGLTDYDASYISDYKFGWNSNCFFAPYDAKNLTLGGIIGEVKSGKVSLPSISVYLDEAENDIGKNRRETNIVIGNYGRVDEGATIDISAGGFVNGELMIELESSPKSLIAGTLVGILEEKASLSRSWDEENYDMKITGPLDNVVAGTLIGINNGNVAFSNGRLLSEIDIPLKKATNLVLGGVMGEHHGKFDGNSYGSNTILNTDISKNLKIGVVAGSSDGYINLYDTGNYTACYNSSQEVLNCGFVGEIKNIQNTSFSYNIINIDADDGMQEIDFKPFGNLEINKKGFKSFKDNYLGYMRVVELYKPEHVYMVRPINAHGDTPPDIDDKDFPFLATYELSTDDEFKKFVEINNPTTSGIATVTLNQDILAGILVRFKVVASDAKDFWTGHIYKNNDISSYETRHPDGEKPQIEMNQQAVIVGSIAPGGPLPMINGTVSFNYYNLPYEYVDTYAAFIDISNDEFKTEILDAANRLIVKGVGDDKFEPTRNITRAEFATMAIRALGLIPMNQQMFEDVSNTAWYSGYVNSAAQWNIIVGVGNGRFLPNDNITREEAMVIVERIYNEILRPNIPTLKEATYSNMIDSNISDWAIDGAMFNLANNIIPLRNSELMPSELLTRSETAATFINLLKMSNLID